MDPDQYLHPNGDLYPHLYLHADAQCEYRQDRIGNGGQGGGYPDLYHHPGRHNRNGQLGGGNGCAAPNLTFVSYGAVPAGGTTIPVTGNQLVWNFPSLGPGIYSFTYQAQVAAYVPQGAVLNNNASLMYAGLATPKTTFVYVTMATAYTVHIGVYNEAGELIKEISVQRLSEAITDFGIFATPTITSLHGQVYIEYKGIQIATWDGTNNANDPVTNGDYYVKVDNVDPFGVVTSITQLVTVSRSLAKVQVYIYNEAGEIVRRLTSYVDDPNNISLSNVSLSTSVISPTLSGTPTTGSTNLVHITTDTGMNLIWDGKNDNGAIVSNGYYQVEIHWQDGKGNDVVITRGILVQAGNQSFANGKVTAQPNVLTKGSTKTTFVMNSSSAYTLKVWVYDMAGELLVSKVTRGDLNSNSVTVDMGGVASGIYFGIVELTDASGGQAGRQTCKLLVVR